VLMAGSPLLAGRCASCERRLNAAATLPLTSSTSPLMSAEHAASVAELLLVCLHETDVR